MSESNKDGSKGRPGQLVMCHIGTDPECGHWSRHGRIIAGIHCNGHMSEIAFSSTAMLREAHRMIEANLLHPGSFNRIEDGIMRMFRDQPNLHRADLIVRAFGSEGATRYLDIVFGKHEEGSGEARWQPCTGQCNFMHGVQLPPHGKSFMKGSAYSDDPIRFSLPAALDDLKKGVEKGLFLEIEANVVRQQIEEAGLLRERSRADLMCEHLVNPEREVEFFFSVRLAENGSGETRIEVRAPGEAPHRQTVFVYINGFSKPIGHGCSIREVPAQLDELVSRGQIALEDRDRLLADMVQQSERILQNHDPRGVFPG